MATLFRTVNLCGGEILIDNVNITAYERRTLRYEYAVFFTAIFVLFFLYFRQTLAIIPQDPFLFSGTIRENLDPYKQYADEEIYRILEKCYVRDLVASLGNGLESVIVERGRNFSVGQKQVRRKY